MYTMNQAGAVNLINPLNNPVVPRTTQNFSNYSMPMGRWAVVNNFNEVQTTPVPADGSQILFMLKDEPVLYMVSMVEGQRMIQAFSITPLVMEQPVNRENDNSIESRMNRLESSIAQLMDALGEKKEA